MELLLKVHAEKLPEGLYLATSDELPGLVAQGRNVSETVAIARDASRRLLEARREREGSVNLPQAGESTEWTIVVAAQV